MRPNRHTLGLVGVLLAMWYAGASQNNAAAYLLGFLTFSVAAVSALHGWANLRHLRLTADPIAPVFEEEPIVLCVGARAESGRRHLAVRLQAKGGKASALLAEITPESTTRAELLAPAMPRGRHSALEVIATSTFPLGFFTALRLVRLTQPFYVYPKPAGVLPFPSEIVESREAQVGMQAEGDDFAGVREWHRGQSMRHVDWKAVARGQRLMVKQWSGSARDPLTFSWAKLEGLSTEERLRQLARWIVQAERVESPYGLEIPGAEIAFSRGDAHFHRCLRALADFRDSGEAAPRSAH